jgi:riboflavin synthase alpha subunit
MAKDQLAIDVQAAVRIGLKHARMMVEKLPTSVNGVSLTIGEYRAVLIDAIKELEREELL